ncbi:hypothetical protein H0A36_23665 [Endozoicomonas sp. SM1973]|uniref:Deoxynucleotide monophosphate kinase n=1 Tax=Spartinivicinus marinus TaxID=2994442 RepID=A0A853IB12_9GAMM|nr:hypothetical protein [Spartinivicinus marinus]MCX4026046.1 hypothetical protein [Spartinivicinus marinus]NYZ69022.1 hypothetical protein [Spartinivicinus marinus]
MLIGITGETQSGKNYFADLLQEQLPEYNRYDLSSCINKVINEHFWKDLNPDQFKDIEVFTYPNKVREIIESLERVTGNKISKFNLITTFIRTFQAYRVNEKIDENGFRQPPIYKISPRRACQIFGAEVRGYLDAEFWLKPLKKMTDTIVTDVKTDKEAEYIRGRGGIMISIVRRNNLSIENFVLGQEVSQHLINQTVLYHADSVLMLKASQIANNLAKGSQYIC